MPDLTGMPALDVALGLAFLYWLLSIVASSIQELIASILSWRARNLETAIRNLLDDPRGEGGTELTKKLYANWRIQALFKKPYAQNPETADPPASRGGPSYIPAEAFALALLDTLAPDVADPQKPNSDLIAEAQGTVADLPEGRLKRQLSQILNDAAANRDAARAALEKLFDDAMERATGWYKRKAQYFVWVIAAIVAFGLNVNTFHVGSRLWKDDALRAAVVAKAQEAVEQPADDENEETDAESCPDGQVREGSTEADCVPDPDALEAVAESVDGVQQLELPLGWSKDNTPNGLLDWLGWLAGCLLTAAAIGLGAPFWFDALQRISRVRGTGARPGKGTGKKPAPS